jgi:hypothetical protein
VALWKSLPAHLGEAPMNESCTTQTKKDENSKQKAPTPRQPISSHGGSAGGSRASVVNRALFYAAAK